MKGYSTIKHHNEDRSKTESAVPLLGYSRWRLNERAGAPTRIQWLAPKFIQDYWRSSCRLPRALAECQRAPGNAMQTDRAVWRAPSRLPLIILSYVKPYARPVPRRASRLTARSGEATAARRPTISGLGDLHSARLPAVV